ncbi:MAG: 2-hydroxyacyl-CoA dehydratase [Deltaproteobacteria bacterium]|nr:2-hydroxyacyl-CoA dehydratase [Deltaproteobacteria bacterium]MBW1929866.1 2-hydroxyacyl-CoA dehydratase [Deltaproteobacteria bacterium]MBW2025761.1 2-hydroxyacyl-CoA dehydratase [Deltaproteobacteria bacterium]
MLAIKESLRKEIAATKTLKKIMANHFYELDEAARTGSKKVAWCTSVGPAELLRGMGFLVYFPENHGAMLGATRMATELIPYANAIGYSPDICSYLTSDIGSYLQKKTPLTKAYNIESVPRPDVLVFNTNQCRDVQDWFTWYGREFGVPVVGIHTHRDIGRIRDYQIKDIAKQIEDLIPPLEEVTGEKFDMDRFKEAVALSRQCSILWRRCLEAAAAIPSPWTFFDATIHMGPAVVARGTKEAVDYYELLLEELTQRVKDGTAAVEGERYRLYWEGMPIWGKLRSLSELFASLQTCIVASTYCNSWIFDQLDPDEPFESMARAYTELFIVRDEAYKEEYIKSCFEFFKLHGIIFHDAKTCPNNSNNRYGMPERLSKKLGIPTLTINGDLNDLRCYSEEQAKTNIEAFIEQLEEE